MRSMTPALATSGRLSFILSVPRVNLLAIFLAKTGTTAKRGNKVKTKEKNMPTAIEESIQIITCARAIKIVADIVDPIIKPLKMVNPSDNKV